MGVQSCQRVNFEMVSPLCALLRCRFLHTKPNISKQTTLTKIVDFSVNKIEHFYCSTKNKLVRKK